MLKISLGTPMCYAKFLAQHADFAAFMQQHVAEILQSYAICCIDSSLKILPTASCIQKNFTFMY